METIDQQAKTLGISQADIAEKLGLTKQAISAWWSDFEKVPKKRIQTLEGMGFKFPGRYYAPEETAYMAPSVTPEQVIEAWVLVQEACAASGARPDLMPAKGLGRLLAIVAEKISRGEGLEARAALLEEAKDLVGSMAVKGRGR